MRMRWAGIKTRIGEKRNVSGFWLGNLKGSTTGKPRHSWENIITINNKEIG
jgi:hypothetical protein